LSKLSDAINLHRLHHIGDFFRLVWFITAQALLLSTIHTCRTFTPLLWWLAFALVCTLYLLMAKSIFDSFKLLFFLPIFYVRISGQDIAYAHILKALQLFRECIFLFRRSSHAQDFNVDNEHEEKPYQNTIHHIPLGIYTPADATSLDAEVVFPPRTHLPQYVTRRSDSPAKPLFLLRQLRRPAPETLSEWEKVQDTEGRRESPSFHLTADRTLCATCLNDFQEEDMSIDLGERGTGKCLCASSVTHTHFTYVCLCDVFLEAYCQRIVSNSASTLV
jgi:hypothetical protein